MLNAQEKEKTTVILKNGTKITAYVEKQPSGGYELTTEDGNIFIFNSNEIKSIGESVKKSEKIKKYKYWELKQMYSAKDYQGRKIGDRFNPTGIGVASFLLPGLGQYITGCQVGWGVMQTICGISSLAGGSKLFADGFIAAGASVFAVWLGMSTWSCCSAVKAAKIKNLYYRDLKNQVTYKFDLSPYVDVTAPVLASNQNMVAGLSFRVSF